MDSLPRRVHVKVLEALHDSLGNEGVGVGADLNGADQLVRYGLHSTMLGFTMMFVSARGRKRLSYW